MKKYIGFGFLMSSFIASSLYANESLLCAEHIEKGPCYVDEIDEQGKGVVHVVFQEGLDEVLFDAQCGKSALEQFLAQGFTYADLRSPYRWMILIDSRSSEGKVESFQLLYPHRMEVHSRWSRLAHRALLKSDKLAAAVYREIREHADSESTIDAGIFGIWKCEKSGNSYGAYKVS